MSNVSKGKEWELGLGTGQTLVTLRASPEAQLREEPKSYLGIVSKAQQAKLETSQDF